MEEQSIPELKNYSISRPLGSGGMGTVYQAEDRLGKQLAIKVIHPELATKSEFKDRFFNEARVLDKLGQHPNIVFLWGLFEESDVLYIVMDFVEGDDLGVVIHERTGLMAVEYALPVFRQVLDAIGFAHARGVVHRDIKPSNILVPAAPDGGPPRVRNTDDVKVMDFGIARALHDPRLTTQGVIGTPEYMAPELFEEGQDAGEQTDIYSLGVTIYELVTGQVPFKSKSGTTAASLYQIARDKLEESPPPPTTHYPPLDKGVEAVIMSAIARNPADRIGSVAALAQAVDEQIDRLGIEVPGKDRATASATATIGQFPPAKAPSEPELALPDLPPDVNTPQDSVGVDEPADGAELPTGVAVAIWTVLAALGWAITHFAI